MLRRTELNQFSECSKTHPYVLVFEQILGDTITPISAAAGLAQAGFKISMLESGESTTRLGRYSFLGFDPEEIFCSFGATIKIVSEGKSRDVSSDPFTFLSEHRAAHPVYSEMDIPGFLGGYVGYVGYDAIRFFEEIPSSHENELGFPDIYFEWHRKGIVFDHEKGIITLVVVMDGGHVPEESFRDARRIIEEMKTHITRPLILHEEVREGGPVEVDLDDEAYSQVVLRCKEYIRQGDAFQIVPSRLFSKPLTKSPFSVYRSLRLMNPSPYMFYIDTEFGVILGASPEKLVSVTSGEMETIPLAGTRPKKGIEFDAEIQKELLSDEKELAEHTMLVDLGRNDLGKVAQFGSVHVQQFCSVLHFSHVMHLASVLRGQCKEGTDMFDVLKAVFPAGTLSGAPKIRAMEIIDELEKTRRGPYGGAIVMIDTQNNLDSCIAIRMAVIKGQTAYMRAGAGIVFDSIPENEVRETWAKVHVLLDAIDDTSHR